MKYQPNRDYNSNDEVMTPVSLAKKLVKHFKPKGKGLEPCCANGNILKFLDNADWCEINKGKDFFDYHDKVDYIFTNPPWSKIRPFLIHSMELADDIYFLFTINHLWTKARLRDIKSHNFGIKEICIFDTPKEFVSTGFQCGMVHLQRGYKGDIKFSELYENGGNVSLINGHTEGEKDFTKPNVLPKEAFEELKVLNEGSKSNDNN